MEAGSVMKRVVVCIRGGASIESAHAVMVRRGIRHLPVVEGRRLLGIISDRDLLIRAGVEPDGTLRYPDQVAADAMTTAPVTCKMADSLQHIASLMVERRIDCVPVVNDAGELLGIVTSYDFLELARQNLPAEGLPFQFTVQPSGD